MPQQVSREALRRCSGIAAGVGSLSTLAAESWIWSTEEFSLTAAIHMTTAFVLLAGITFCAILTLMACVLFDSVAHVWTTILGVEALKAREPDPTHLRLVNPRSTHSR